MASAVSPAERGPGGSYEFTTAQNDVIGALGWKMRLVGLILLIFGLLNLVAAILIQVAFHQIGTENIDVAIRDRLVEISARDRWIITGYLTVVGAVLACVGAWTRSAGGSFARITTTKGSDVSHLMEGFQTQHKMYSLMATALVAAILAYVVLLVYKSMGVVK
jgi:hypothetical protein